MLSHLDNNTTPPTSKTMSQPLHNVLLRTCPQMEPTAVVRIWMEQFRKSWKVAGKLSAKPPLSVEALVVIALFMKQKPATAAAVQEWILTTMGYYRKLSFSIVWGRTTAGGLGDIPAAAKNFLESFKEVFLSFKIPIEKVTGQQLGLNLDKDTWKITPSNALTYLAIHYPVSRLRSGPFRFMDLPAELRVRIYEMVLGFPRSGIAILPSTSGTIAKNNAGKRVMKLLTRSYDREFSWMDWKHNRTYLNGPSLATTLSLLRTNHEIYKEALPVFFNCNKFVFTDFRTLHAFLHRTAAHRRNFIAKLVFQYPPVDASVGPKVFRMLKEMTGLRELEIHFSEAAWGGELKRLDGVKKYPDMLRLPGFRDLRSCRGLKKVEWVGDCETVKGVFVEEMTREKVSADQR